MEVGRGYDRIEPRTASSSSVCLVSTSRGRKFERISEALDRNKREFCAACGYTCIITNGTAHSVDRRPEWDKIALLQQVLRGGDAQAWPERQRTVSEPAWRGSCDIALFVDADMVFLRPFAAPELVDTQFLLSPRDRNGAHARARAGALGCCSDRDSN